MSIFLIEIQPKADPNKADGWVMRNSIRQPMLSSK